MKLFVCLTAFLFSINCYAQNLEELWKKHAAKDYAYVLENALPLEGKYPENLDLQLLIGRTYVDAGQPSRAIPYLLCVYQEDKKDGFRKAWAANYLGSAYYHLSDSIQAKKYLAEAIAMNATANVTRSSKNKYALFGFSDDYKNFITKESEHIIFHFHPGVSENVEKFMAEREQSFNRINSFFKSSLPKKIDFFVWHSREDMKAATGSAGGFASPENCITHSLSNQTPGHEITHVISHHSGDVSEKSVLINEGTAVYFDQTKGSRFERARTVLKSGGSPIKINIYQIWNSRALDEKVFYAVAGAFVEFIVEKEGKDKFLQFFINQSIENARVVYREKFDFLVSEFERSLNGYETEGKSVKSVSSAAPKLDSESVNNVLEQNPSSRYYKTLILVNGKPITTSQMEKLDPASIKNLQVIKLKDEIRKYSDVELNGIILITQ
jgi:hypothetical protein